MKVKSIELEKRVFRIEEIIKNRKPKIVFSGRSNVGKSSLINTISGRKRIAFVGKSPGKTRSINYYIVNEKYYFVDLPGYGFAKVSKKEREAWAELIDSFFKNSSGIVLNVLILDSKAGITQLDEKMIQYATVLGVPTVLVLNKIDKLKKSEMRQRKKIIERELNLTFIPFSSKTGEGKKELLGIIYNRLKEKEDGKRAAEC